MAFLDNSGDIILDAVLTDTGRRRLARGDGSFKITKFALGDDEINYRLFDGNHSSGSAYYDLQVLQTPILEAFTDPEACLHHRLMSLSRNDVLYLPIMELFERADLGSVTDSTTRGFFGRCRHRIPRMQSGQTQVLYGARISHRFPARQL